MDDRPLSYKEKIYIIKILGTAILIAAIPFSLFFLLSGCAEMPDREMNEYIDMNCVMQIDGRAFCR